jgi:hypothetical protein
MSKIFEVIKWIEGDGILKFLQRRRWVIFVVLLAFADYAALVFLGKPHLTALAVTALTIGGVLVLGWAENKFRWNQYDE